MSRTHFLAFSAGALLLGSCEEKSVKSTISRPNLAAQGWLNLPSGKTSLANDDLDGKALFVEFWATW